MTMGPGHTIDRPGMLPPKGVCALDTIVGVLNLKSIKGKVPPVWGEEVPFRDPSGCGLG
jgi:hypothetical protein